MSNYTQLGFVKQTDGENEGSWGDVLNENLIDLLDDAIGGYVEVSVASGNVTLAFADGTADNNGRHAVIKFTGSPGTTRTVTFPDAQINYFIINGSDGSVICTSGTGAATVTIPTGMKDIIYVDGSDEVLSMLATPHISGNVTIGVDDTGYDVKFFGATSGSYMLWDESADSLLLTDSTPLKIGDSQDLTLYHDGSNSYITNAVGALKIATETSGIAVTIGHTTSETTIADNLTTTGNTSVGGTLGVTGVATFSTHVALGDSDILKLGAAPDMQLYHDGTNSYITNATGALKIATETSGIAVTIGHTTSETTIADNATITGNLSVGGNFDVTGTLDFSDSAITNVGDIALDTITNDGTDITLDSSNDIVIDAAGGNVEFKDAGTLQFTIDMDGTAGAQVIKLGVDSDDLVFQQYDGNEVMRIADNRKVYFYDEGGEHISSDGTDFTFASGNDINLTATTDINVPADVGMTFGDDGEKIEGDGTDLTIASSGVLNLAAGGTTNQVKVTDGAILPITDDDVDLGSASYQFKNAYFDGTLEADAITIGGTAVTAGGASAGFALAMAVAL